MPTTTDENVKELFRLTNAVLARRLKVHRAAGIERGDVVPAQAIPGGNTEEELAFRAFLVALPDSEVLRLETLYYFGEGSARSDLASVYANVAAKGVEYSRSNLKDKVGVLWKHINRACGKLATAKLDINGPYDVH